MLWGSTRAQSADFQQQVNPFRVADLDGTVWVQPFTGGTNAPTLQLVDIDNDGDPDLFVQDRADQLTFYRNDGTPTQYQFNWQTDFFADLATGAWFKFIDMDGDGDFDLFAENPFSLIRYYRNTGSPENPSFEVAVDTLRDTAGNLIEVDGFSVPDWADIDCNGTIDLFLGRTTGFVTYYQGLGLDGQNNPLFTFVTNSFEDINVQTGGGLQPAGSSRHGANSITFIDIDDDGDLDLFWGDFFAESVVYLQNDGTCGNPDINITTQSYPPQNPISTGGFNVPRFGDIDGDGDWDMFIGVIGGATSTTANIVDNIFFYENAGSLNAPDFQFRTSRLIETVDIGANANPALFDIDDDGDLDLLLGNQQDLNSPDEANSRLHFFENRGSATVPALFLADIDYLENDRRFDLNYDPTLGDLDGDGDPDMLVGKWDGRLSYFENQGSASAPNFQLIDNFYAAIDVGNYNTPTLVDIDNDGDLDLICGEFFGNLNLYRNTGSASSPVFTEEDLNFGGIAVGEFSHPAFSDFDLDGDLDLFVGSDLGGCRYFRNDGSATAPSFTPDPTQDFAGYLRTAPFFADIEGDGDEDLFLGVNGGGLVFFRNLTFGGSNGVDEGELPQTITLLSNYPNPFNPGTTIRFRLGSATGSGAAAHRLTIFDLTGREVFSWDLAPGEIEGERYWDGNNRSGHPVGSGVYFYRLQTGKFGKTQKLILLR